MTRRRQRKPFDPYYWTQSRGLLFCALGSHQASAGEWVRYRRGDYRKLGCCETCLKAHGISKPTRSFTMSNDAGVDEKARQAGDE